jgi:hypothetical protein
MLTLVTMATFVLIGAAIWFRPFLGNDRQVVSEVPGPAGLFSVAEFTVPAKASACMTSVGIDINSRFAEFTVHPSVSTPAGGPPIQFSLSAPGYRSSVRIPKGYPGGVAKVAVTPPKQDVIGTACFANLGKTPAIFAGSSEPRTTTRSKTSIDGRTLTGGIALVFSDRQSGPLLQRLNEVFDHASNLTDRLVPSWLIWILALLVAFGVPIAVIAAYCLAVSVDQRSPVQRNS